MKKLMSVFGTAVLLLATLAGTGTAASAAAGSADTAKPQLLSPTPYHGMEHLLRARRRLRREQRSRGSPTVWSTAGLPTPAMTSSGSTAAGRHRQSRDAAGDLLADRRGSPRAAAAGGPTSTSSGLQAGIYTDAGPTSRGRCGLGSGGHYQHDAEQFAAWRFDAVKVDFLCGIAADLDPKTAYTAFAQALRNNASGRPMIFNLCNP